MFMIKTFNEIHKEDVMQAGGKGASLGEMTNANLPVPEGFVILSKEFNDFLDANEIKDNIDATLHTVNKEDMNSIENASEKIQSIIMNSSIKDETKEKILESFDNLDCQFVAVRSSATAEDGHKTAWAGQLDTFLNTQKCDLLENVKKCWASLFTPRAIYYRYTNNLHNDDISVAVVIQKMVESEVSGVAFSVHPVTEDINQMIIEAGLGLGESIVSGQITPDSYVVEKDPFLILDIQLSEQEKGLFRGNNGNEWKQLDNGDKQKLTGEQITELAKLVIKIEQHYGFPVDIEWALENEKFYITQSRPITTLVK